MMFPVSRPSDDDEPFQRSHVISPPRHGTRTTIYTLIAMFNRVGKGPSLVTVTKHLQDSRVANGSIAVFSVATGELPDPGPDSMRIFKTALEEARVLDPATQKALTRALKVWIREFRAKEDNPVDKLLKGEADL